MPHNEKRPADMASLEIGAGGWCNSPALAGQIAGSRTLPSHRVAAHCPHGIRRRLYRLSPAAWAKTCITCVSSHAARQHRPQAQLRTGRIGCRSSFVARDYRLYRVQACPKAHPGNGFTQQIFGIKKPDAMVGFSLLGCHPVMHQTAGSKSTRSLGHCQAASFNNRPRSSSRASTAKCAALT